MTNQYKIIGPDLTKHGVYKRIISVVPSLTEYIFDLGLKDQIIGATKFCVHPEQEVKDIIKIGGTKTLKIDLIKSLKPDLIIANKEENTQEQIKEITQFSDVYLSDISTIEDSLQSMAQIGIITDRKKNADKIIRERKSHISEIKTSLLNYKRLKSLLLIWKDPYMTVGGDTFISDMMVVGGFSNSASALSRYPTLTQQQIIDLAPDILFLSSEPYPFKNKHVEEISNWLPDSMIILVDGEMFSWYGSRMTKSIPYLSNIRQQLPLFMGADKN